MKNIWNLILLNKIKILLIAAIIAMVFMVLLTKRAHNNSHAHEYVDQAQERQQNLAQNQANQDIIPDHRPSDYEYAKLSERVYIIDIKLGEIINIKGKEWQVVKTKIGGNGYFGALYENKLTKQLVLVHRGTQSIQNIFDDLLSVIFNQLSYQQRAAYDFTQEAVDKAHKNNFHLSITGHSLGAFLAELSAYWCHDKFSYYDINAVTFESPGSRDLIEAKMQSNLVDFRIKPERLDVVQYLSSPNIINTWRPHIGTVYEIYPIIEDSCQFEWLCRMSWNIKDLHSISNIVKYFEDPKESPVLMEDWPSSLPNVAFLQDNPFLVDYKIHYKQNTKMNVNKQIFLKHFNTGMQKFLVEFFDLHKLLLAQEDKRNLFLSFLRNNGIQDSLIDLVSSYQIDDYRNNIKRITITSNKDIHSWRKELSSALAQHPNLKKILLQSLKVREGSTIIPMTIRSELMLPINFLERPDHINEINSALKDNKGIQIIVLRGIGGAGKSTLAKYYGKFKTDIATSVFEVKAETKDTLVNSFHTLAYEIANTKELKEELESIQQIQNSEIKEKQLLSFIKSGLRERTNWLLIYDNVENLSEIKNLFPDNAEQWGNGKIIITTRDANIQNAEYIKLGNIIPIEELSDDQKLTLFSKILYDTTLDKLTVDQKEKTTNFLKDIPPFPLDISIAAYYIKNEHLSYEEYLERILKYGEDFEVLQGNIIPKMINYEKTRYGIISSSLEKFVNDDQIFKEFLFIISLLGAEDIPKKLLEYDNNIIKMDQFLHNMRKHGLIMSESMPHENDKSYLSMFSIHRSTQDMILRYLMIKMKKLEIEKIMTVVEGYHKQNLSDNCLAESKFIPHLKAASANIKRINLSQKTEKNYLTSLNFWIGYGHYKCTNDFKIANTYLEQAYNVPAARSFFMTDVLTDWIEALCSTYVLLNESDKALKCAEDALTLCEKNKNSQATMAKIFQLMGSSYRKENNLTEAEKYYTKSIEVLGEMDMELKKELAAEGYALLGTLYSEAFLNKDVNGKAEKSILQALELFNARNSIRKTHTTTHGKFSCYIGKHKWRLGSIYNRLGKFDEALDEGLYDAEYIMENNLDNCSNDLLQKGRVFEGMGQALLRKAQLNVALNYQTRSINTFKQILGESAAFASTSFRIETFIRLNKFEEAYQDFLTTLKFDQNRKNNYYQLMQLSNLYHAAFIQYKQKNFKKSHEHFMEFTKKIQTFCKIFLDKGTYENLVATGMFVEMNYDDIDPIKNISIYLENSVHIFSAIYGQITHPFIKDYVLVNSEELQKVVKDSKIMVTKFESVQ